MKNVWVRLRIFIKISAIGSNVPKLKLCGIRFFQFVYIIPLELSAAVRGDFVFLLISAALFLQLSKYMHFIRNILYN